MTKKSAKDNYYRAFKIILEKAVGINSDAQITVVYDELFQTYFDSLLSYVNATSLSVTYIFIPVSYQHMIQNSEKFEFGNNEVTLPTGLSTALSNSDVVLNFLNGNINSSKIRGAIIDKQKNKNCQLVHCPGISDEILNLILISPFKTISLHSEMIAWALGTTKNAKLITRDSLQNEYQLTIDLEGWDNEPIISSGTIVNGSWGNIPPGETFCCPNPLGVTGDICINGSVPGIVLKGEEECVLTFAKGKLINWQTRHKKLTDFFKHLENISAERNDRNWNMFAELGIGLNPVIKKLTGNSLFDEKMAGTIHIALGDNVVFGHEIESKIHADLVTLRPTLLLDEKTIINNGVLNLKEIQNWRKGFIYKKLALQKTDILSVRAAKIRVTTSSVDRKLYKKNRVGYVNILSKRYRSVVEILTEILEYDNDVIYKDLLKKVGPRNRNTMNKIIDIFHFYKMITIEPVITKKS